MLGQARRQWREASSSSAPTPGEIWNHQREERLHFQPRLAKGQSCFYQRRPDPGRASLTEDSGASLQIDQKQWKKNARCHLVRDRLFLNGRVLTTTGLEELTANLTPGGGGGGAWVNPIRTRGTLCPPGTLSQISKEFFQPRTRNFLIF